MLEIRVIRLIAELDGCEYANPFYKMNGEFLKPYFLDSINLPSCSEFQYSFVKTRATNTPLTTFIFSPKF
jgi:hypothetical protein